MKKIITLVLALCMALTALTACGNAPAKTAKVIDIDLTEEQYAFGVDPSQPELLEKVNAFIAKIKSNGTLDEIMDRYFSNGTPVGVKSATEDPSKNQLVLQQMLNLLLLNIPKAAKNSTALIWKSQNFLLTNLVWN